MTLDFSVKLKRGDKKIIEKALEDAGFGECVVDLEFNQIKMPDLYKGEVPIIAGVLAEAGDYRIDTYFDDLVIDDD